jgi:hypothetical protein
MLQRLIFRPAAGYPPQKAICEGCAPPQPNPQRPLIAKEHFVISIMRQQLCAAAALVRACDGASGPGSSAPHSQADMYSGALWAISGHMWLLTNQLNKMNEVNAYRRPD